MGKSLSDFLIKDFRTGLLFQNVEELKKLPLEEFREMYVGKMQTYFDNHSRPTISCWRCPEKIISAGDLVRRYGRSLHVKCFKEEYEEEREEDSPGSQVYFDLVLVSLRE